MALHLAEWPLCLMTLLLAHWLFTALQYKHGNYQGRNSGTDAPVNDYNIRGESLRSTPRN